MMNIEDVRTVPIGPYSAYAIAVKYGFVGTEAEWLASLTGPRGEKGDRGEKGEDGSILSTSAIQQMIDDVISAEHEKLRFWASPDPTSPAQLFGGTWERIEDVFILAASDNHKAGTTGGEENHALTVSEMPKHRLSANGIAIKEGYWSGSSDDWYAMRSAEKSNETKSVEYTSYIGEDQPHNNMPPYLALYMWRRT